MFTVEQPIHLHFIISPAHARPQRLARGPALGRAIREEAPPRLRRARGLLPGRSLRRHQQHLGDVLRELCRQIRLIAYLMYLYSYYGERANFTGLVLGCIKVDLGCIKVDLGCIATALGCMEAEE